MVTHFIQENLDGVIAKLNTANEITLDIEATGLEPIDSRMLLCQLGFRDDTNFVIDVDKVDIRTLKKPLESVHKKFIIFNAKFDTKFLFHQFDIRIANLFDPMLARQVIKSQEYATSLETLSPLYGGPLLDKSLQKSFINHKGEYSQEQIAYAAEDARVLWLLYDAMSKELKDLNMENIADIEFRLAPIVGRMELAGIPIDVMKWRALIEETKISLKNSASLLYKILGGRDPDEQHTLFDEPEEIAPINLKSTKQIAKAFLNIGINLPLTEKGNYATNERILEKINHPVAKELLSYRGYQKIIDAYSESFLDKIHPFTNRIHPDFNQIGTETGRFSCENPNFQQVPKKFRSCVGGATDYEVVGADYAGMELRIIAELSEDENLLGAFVRGEDPHKSTASLMFNIPIENVTTEQRFIAKTINFGLAYGMGGPKLMDTINAESAKKITLNEAYKLLNKHESIYRTVSRYFETSGKQAFLREYSETMSGRKRFYVRPEPGLPEKSFLAQRDALYRKGGNSPIQGTNADITKLAMIQIQDAIDTYKLRANLMVQVHDEIVLLAHKSHSLEVKRLVEQEMLDAAQQVLKKVPVKVESYVSEYWEK